MKKILIFTVLLVGVLAFGFTQTGNSWTVNNTATWIEAVNGIRSGGNNKTYTITVTGNVSVPASTESTFGSVTGITVTIEGSGTLSPSANGNLLFIGEKQTIIAKNVTLRGRSDNGSFSVVGISSGGIFRMEGSAKVTGNTISGNGGGVYVDEQGTFTMQDTASVSGNTISGNSPRSGGGVCVNEDAIFTMQDSATVTGNTNTTKSSGGWVNFEGAYGGGVCVLGTFTMRDNASVAGNASPNCPGGGVYVSGTFTLQDNATVTGNKDRGVYVSGTFIMQGGTISKNTSSSFSNNDAYSSGGGVYVSGTFTMQGGTIIGNTANSSSSASYVSVSKISSTSFGGGVYISSGTFVMHGGTITGNTASASSKGIPTSSYGGGVYVGKDNGYSQTFIMEGGTISNNISSSSNSNSYGGGVYNHGNFTMKGNSIISGNTAYYGGGVYSYTGTGSWSGEETTFIMHDNASVLGNTAFYGGGVYNDNSTFTIEGNISMSDNTATYFGGGVYNSGTFTKIGGIIYGNDAEPSLKNSVISRLGHAVYETNNGGWRNSTAGPTMNSDSYGFWLNDGDVVMFHSSWAGTLKRSNFNNTLTLTLNTIKSSSSNNLWVLQSKTGDAYTFKRGDATNTITLTIRVVSGNLLITGDSGSGQDNWNGTWSKQRQQD